LRVTILFGIVLLAGCSVPERHVAGGPYCVVLYADYSFRPARLLGKSRSEAEDILEKGRPIGIAYFSGNGLLERSRECWKTECTDWFVYEYDPSGNLMASHPQSASDSRFDVASCPELPPQWAVKLPRQGN
jgi:hypothetical protein